MPELKYQSGFGNQFSSEALPGALPEGMNSPQKPPYGLYPEQLSGSAFTAPRPENRRSWLYRIRPSVVHGPYREIESGTIRTAPLTELPANPNQMRWDPPPIPTNGHVDFIDGLITVAATGDAGAQTGCAAHLYAINRDMDRRFFYTADGELLIVPQLGTLILRTELGVLEIKPGEIAVVPRGMKFQVRIAGGAAEARGYVCENYGHPLRLPDLGPIGANGLANPRDFLAPLAAFDDEEGEFELVAKFSGGLWSCRLGHSPLDVVAWHGNLAPYKYDLSRFNTINTVSFDHPDPSIFTVLTSPSDTPGMANVDFVIFPPRWMVAENTFRPPYYHRNVMSEFMGLIHGTYDAKEEGFVPGGSSLHNCMSPHGPDAVTFEKATNAKLEPHKQTNTLAFMFESRYVFRVSEAAQRAPWLQENYGEVWNGIKKHFRKK